jgi:hypothetical protein
MLSDKSVRPPKQYFTLARVLFFYFGSVIILAFTSYLTKNLSEKIADLLSIVSAIVLTFFLVFIFTRLEKRSLYEIGIIPGKKSIVRFVVGYIAGLSMAITQALIVLSTGHFRLAFVSQLPVSEIVLPFFLYLFVACREELVFRSYPLRSLNDALGPWTALFLITMLFVLEHVLAGMSWKIAIVGSGLGGILFGLSALKTKGLALPWGLHSAWNFGQWLMGFKTKAGVWKTVVEKGYEVEVERTGLVAFVLVIVIAIAGVLIVYREARLESL